MKRMRLSILALLGLGTLLCTPEAEVPCMLQVEGPGIVGLEFGMSPEQLGATERGYRQLSNAEIQDEGLWTGTGDIFKSTAAYLLFSPKGRLQIIYVPDARYVCARNMPLPAIEPERLSTLFEATYTSHDPELDVYDFWQGDLVVTAQYVSGRLSHVSFGDHSIISADMGPRITQPYPNQE